MKKILIIMKRYYPEVSASTNLMMPLISELKKEHNIYILVSGESDKTFIDNGIKVITYTRKKDNIFNRVRRKLSINGYNINEVKRLTKVIKTLDQMEKFDIIVPITFEEIIASLEYKKIKKDKNLVPYMLEQFLNENKNNFIGKTNRERLKIKIQQNSCCIFVLPVLKNYFKEDSNIRIVEHPMILNNIKNERKEKAKIEISYLGGLDRKQRNPENVLEILSKLKCNKEIEINIYSYGNCGDIVKKIKEKSINKINNNKPIDSKKANEILRDSDINITIGNRDVRVMPSKIFDCISTGRPIIHFYFNEGDPYISYLEKYNNSICINLNNSEYLNRKRIEDFIEKTYAKVESFENIEKNFIECTPSYVAKQFNEEFRKQLGPNVSRTAH